jgi:Na+-transporting methylmalonyl-CoA/oxaloacetate decarboxylase gamma subunit
MAGKGTGPMNAALSLLGAALLILIGLAVVLAVVILILYEASWILRLSGQLSRSTAAAEQACAASKPIHAERGRS